MFNYTKSQMNKRAAPIEEAPEDLDQYRRVRYTPNVTKPIPRTINRPVVPQPIEDNQRIKWSPQEMEAHIHETMGEGATDVLQQPDQTKVNERNMVTDMKKWVAAQYDAEHGIISRNPFNVDPRWFLDERPENMMIEKNPIALFWPSAKAALTKPYSYDQKPPTVRISRVQDLEAYALKLVQEGKSNTPARGSKDKRVSMPGGLPAANNIKERFPFVDTFARTLGPKLRKIFDRQHQHNSGNVEEGFNNGLLTAFSETSTGIRNDLRFWMWNGWNFLPDMLKHIISQKLGVNLDDENARKEMATNNEPAFAAELAEYDTVLHSRLEGLFSLCADPVQQRMIFKHGLRMLPDVSAMSESAKVSYINKFQSAAVRHAWNSIELRTTKFVSDIHNKTKKEQPGEVQNADGSTSNIGEIAGARPQMKSEDVFSNQNDLVETQIKDAVLPTIRKQFSLIADDIDKLGGMIANGLRYQKTPATTNKKSKLIPNAYKHSSMFKVFANVVSQELREIANEATGFRLMDILMSVAYEQGLLKTPPASNTYKGTNSPMRMRENSTLPRPTKTLGSMMDGEHGVNAVKSHSTLGKLWDLSKPTQDVETIDYAGGTKTFPGRSSLANRLDITSIVRSSRFKEILRQGKAIRVNLKTPNATRTGWPFLGDPAQHKGVARKDSLVDEKEFAKLKDNMSIMFPWWSNYLILPEVMERTSPISRQVLMDTLPVREGLKTGQSNLGNGIHALKYYYAGIYGLENAPAVFQTSLHTPNNEAPEEGKKKPKLIKSLGEKEITPMQAVQQILKWQQQVRQSNRYNFQKHRFANVIALETKLLKIARRMEKFASVDRTHIDAMLAQVRKTSAFLWEACQMEL